MPTTPSSTPTSRQQAYLDYIAAYIHTHRQAPSEADMQRYFNVTAPSVHTMVITLERRGFIRRTPGQARSITLVPRTARPPLASPAAATSIDDTMAATPSKKNPPAGPPSAPCSPPWTNPPCSPSSKTSTPPPTPAAI